MTAINLKQVETDALVDELKDRAGVQHASLIDGMFSSVSLNGPVEVLMVKPEAPNDPDQQPGA